MSPEDFFAKIKAWGDQTTTQTDIAVMTVICVVLFIITHFLPEQEDDEHDSY